MPNRLEVLEQMVARGTNDPFPMYGLALEYRSLGRTDDALRAMGDLRARVPDYVPQYLMAAQILRASSRVEEAREWAEAGLVVASRSRDAHAAGELEAVLAELSR